MVWVRLADDFPQHPKVLAAGAPAAYLWVCSLAYSNHFLTDGVIPAGVVGRLADVDEPQRLAARLVQVGLWEPIDGGYLIHDFGEYQPTAAQVRHERRLSAGRSARWRERRYVTRDGGVDHPSGDGARNGVGAPAPYPDPDPYPDPGGDATPQPPPGAEGGRTTGADARDAALWRDAAARAGEGMSDANAALVATLRPVGRGADGGLRLRAADPGAGCDLRRFGGVVRRALLDAGDAEAARAVILP